MHDRHPRQCRLVHGKLRAGGERGVRPDEAKQFRNALGRPTSERQEADGFRQPPCQDRDHDQWRDATNHKHRAPAEVRDQRGCEKAAKCCAHRKAAEHDHHHGGAAATWIELRGHGNRVRHRAAKAEPGCETDRKQRIDVLDKGGGERAEAECQGREDDDLLAPDAIGKRPEQQRADHQPKQAGGEYRTKRTPRHAPFLGDRRRDITDRLGIEAVEEQHGRAGQQ